MNLSLFQMNKRGPCVQSSTYQVRVYFARDFIFFKGPNNVIGLYWRLKFEWEQFCVDITQPSDFVMIFLGML